MIALFDSGNSKLHFAWWDGEKVKDAVTIPYPESTDSLPDVISELLGGRTLKKIAACSVASQWREPLFETLDSCAPGKLVVARNAYDIGLDVRYDKPETLGIDRALADHAAYCFFNDSCVVIDAGTAVTVDVVSESGAVLGGLIFPGIDVLFRSLGEKTDLPEVSQSVTCGKIGNSTESCIFSGISTGYSGAITKLVEKAAETAGSLQRIVITGGDAELLLKCLPFKMIHIPYLVLDGLGITIGILPKYH
ncbi:type III pantothenate kinase [Candidatus Latescibacterota bacterium]